MDKCQEKQIQEKIENLNSPTSVKQIEFSIKDPLIQNTKDLKMVHWQIL